ncbi:hypothetical protein F511_20132 [Dorcoceras hygrometricum]|uniref:Uncharacterized protein n=1 Tax=Dorcoceras hygrometricum TaxID=472368 RepID=A0A2Z7BQS9_9LAMI|nr:hypothetical protein F511_20132 [Dorcoceras hygrometricum]
MVAAGSRRAIVRVIEEATRVWFEEPVTDEKRRRLVKWKRCVLGSASGTSSEGFVALLIQSREISVVYWWSAAASFCLVGTVSFWMFLENATTGCCVWFCCGKRLAPGSDQFHEETGTSNGRRRRWAVGGGVRRVGEDIIGYPRMKASGESSTTKHRLLHASGPHPILPSNDPNDYANLAAGRNYLLDGQTSFDPQRVQQLAIHDQQMKKDRLVLAIAKRCRLSKSTRQRFCLRAKDSAGGWCDDENQQIATITLNQQVRYLKIISSSNDLAATIQQQRFSSDANSAATQLQQLSFSDADFVFSTEILDAKQANVVVLYSDHANLAAGRNYLLDGQTSFDQQRVQQLAIRDQQTKKDQLISHRNPTSSCAKFSGSRTTIPDFVLPDFHPQNLNDSIGYPRMKASGESSTTKHRLLHASGPHPILPPNDPKVSMTFRVVSTNQYNQDLGLFHSTNGNHLESPNEGSSIDHQVIIHLHAQNITMFPTNETWYFTSQMLAQARAALSSF